MAIGLAGVPYVGLWLVSGQPITERVGVTHVPWVTASFVQMVLPYHPKPITEVWALLTTSWLTQLFVSGGIGLVLAICLLARRMNPPYVWNENRQFSLLDVLTFGAIRKLIGRQYLSEPELGMYTIVAQGFYVSCLLGVCAGHVLVAGLPLVLTASIALVYPFWVSLALGVSDRRAGIVWAGMLSVHAGLAYGMGMSIGLVPALQLCAYALTITLPIPIIARLVKFFSNDDIGTWKNSRVSE